jgi:Dolichyl-phosphate-mannose-protein mannosyltransferase
LTPTHTAKTSPQEASAREKARRFIVPAVLIAGAAVLAAVGHRHYPIQLWLFWRYASYWLVCGIWSLACLSGGLAATRLIVKQGLPLAERLILGSAAGVYLFALAMFAGGLVGVIGPSFAILLPVALLLAGRSEIPTIARCARRARATPTPSRFFLLASAWGLVCLAMIYLTIMTPENASYDARWYHLPIAEHYAAQGAIRRFPEGWFPGAYPHLSSLLYTWAFSLPQTALFDRVELAAHLEYTLFLATLAGVPILVRRLVPGVQSGAAWTALFLFPSVFVYDSSLTAAADHILAFWAIPIFLALLRALQRLDVRRCLLLALVLAGAAMTKYQAGCLLVFPVLAVLIFAVRRRQWAGPLALCVAALILTSPHWLKNWVWYGDPLYPILHDYLSPKPWTADSKDLFDAYAAVNLWRPVAPTFAGKVMETLGAMFTFSFLPHDWKAFHHGTPIFGSLFSIVVLALPFVKGGRRVAPLAICTLTGVFAWYWVSHQDRYLQALVPWMAATTAATISLIWRSGTLSKVAVGGLVALQVVWGADAYFTPVHPIIGSPVKVAVDLLSSGFRKDYVTRLRPFGTWWDIGVALPKDAKLLVHEQFEHVGTRSTSVSDTVGWQGGISYGRLSGPRDVFDLLTSMGVTHIAYRPGLSEETDSIAGDLIFFEFASRWTRNQKMFGHTALVQMPARPPAAEERSDVVVFLGCEDKYASGRYHLADMVVQTKASPTTKYPTPFLPLGPGDATNFSGSGFAVLDTACHPTLGAEPSRGFSRMVTRGTVELWIRARAGSAQ